MLFRIVWGIDVDRSARRRVLLRLGGPGRFGVDVQHRPVGRYPGGLGLILFGSRALHRKGHRVLATLLAAVPALPALLYGLLIVAMMFSGARWN